MTKQLVTNETAVKRAEQSQTNNLRARIEKLRAEGRTYREIAKQERVSISQISRVLRGPSEAEAGPKTSQTSTVDLGGEEASTVFEMLEKGTALTKIVIDLKLHPDKANQLFQKWRELRLEQLKPLGYLMLTREEIREILAIPYQLSATGMGFVLSEEIFEHPVSLLRRYDNTNDYGEVARLLSIIERIVQRSKTSVV